MDDKQPIRSQRCDAIEEMAEVKYYIVRETLGSTLVIRLGQDLLYDGGKKGKKRGKRRKNVIPQSELSSYILFTVKLKSP